MNKKGQSLTIFIIILPVIFISLAFTYDYATIINEQMKYEGVTKTILKSTQDEEKIKDLYQKNGYSTNNFNYKLDEDKIYIQNNYKFKSTFGKIINIKISVEPQGHPRKKSFRKTIPAQTVQAVPPDQHKRHKYKNKKIRIELHK